MDNEFSIARVKKKLGVFITTLDEILEELEIAGYERKEELIITLSEVRKEVAKEEIRINKSIEEGIECASYLPALKEARMYLTKL